MAPWGCFEDKENLEAEKKDQQNAIWAAPSHCLLSQTRNLKRIPKSYEPPEKISMSEINIKDSCKEEARENYLFLLSGTDFWILWAQQKMQKDSELRKYLTICPLHTLCVSVGTGQGMKLGNIVKWNFGLHSCGRWLITVWFTHLPNIYFLAKVKC